MHASDILLVDDDPDLLRLSCMHEEIAQGLGLANDSPLARPSRTETPERGSNSSNGASPIWKAGPFPPLRAMRRCGGEEL